MIHFIILFSRQGKIRLQKWYEAKPEKEKKKITRELTSTVLNRKPKMSNFLEWKDLQIVYKRYASLFFLFAIDKVLFVNHKYCSTEFQSRCSFQHDNELMVLELIHRYVEVLDKYFGSVCELDIIFNFEKAYYILDELILAGEMQDTSKKAVLKQIEFADNHQEEEIISLALKDVGLI